MMMAIAAHSIVAGLSPSTGMTISEATAESRAIIAVAADEPRSATARLNVKIATPLISTALIDCLHGNLGGRSVAEAAKAEENVNWKKEDGGPETDEGGGFDRREIALAK